MKKIFYTAFLLFAGVVPLKGQDAFVQVIHACADPQADSVDVYVNDGLTLNNFAHRNATSYLALAADTYQIKIAGKNSTSSNDFIYQSPSLVLEAGKYYTIVAAGVLSGPGAPFALYVKESRNSSLQSANTDVLVFHGSADAPVVDVTTAAGNSTLWNNLAFGQFGSYLELPENDYTIEVRDSTGNTAVASYEALLKGLDLGGKAITVVADGYLSPGSGQAAFGLFAITPDGGNFVTLPVSKAKVQIVHNSPNADSVDVYLNGNKLLDNFAFRTATGFVEVNAGTVQSIAVAPKTSGNVSDAIVTIPLTFEANKSYVAVASGIVGGSGSTAFRLIAYADARQTATDTQNTDVLVFHGSTDAPTVDVTTGGGAATLVNNLSYGAFSSGYLPLPTDDYTVEVRNEAGNTVVASYQAPLKSLKLRKSAITVLASGFLAPTGNQPGFGLFAITASGGNFLALPVSKAKVQIIHNSPNADSVDVYLNGNKLLDNFAFRTATGFAEVNAGTVQSIAVAPKTSGSVTDALATIPLTFEANKLYIAIASGIVGGSGDTAFRLIAYTPARDKSRLTGKTDVLIFHGSTNAPAVDVVVTGTSTVLADNMAYGNFNSVGYLELDPLNYSVDIVPAAGGNAVASYSAPLQTLNLGNAALTVIASGYLNPGVGKPAFGLFVAPATEGALIPLPVNTTASRKTAGYDAISIWPVPAGNTLNIRSGDQIEKIAIISPMGRLIQETTLNRKVHQLELNSLSPGVYLLQVTTDKGVNTKQFIVD